MKKINIRIIRMAGAAIGIIALIVTLLLVINSPPQEAVTSLKRPARGEGVTDYDVWVIYEGQKEEITVSLSEKAATKEELEIIFEGAYEQAIKEFLNGNTSLDNITQSVKLVNEVSGYPMKAEWFIADTSIINYWGDILCSDKDSECEIILTLKYAGNTNVQPEDTEKEYRIPIHISPENMELNSLDSIMKMIEEADKLSADMEELPLPEKFRESELRFLQKKDNPLIQIILLIMLVPIVVIIKLRNDKDVQKKERVNSFVQAYPELVTKLSLLIGAGMTPYNALCRISKDGKDNPAYEEIRAIVSMIDSGMPEKDAYRQIGARFGLHSYCKLGMLLEQEVIRGNERIRQDFKLEVNEALEDRKARARKAGEQAGTKLLVPMMMMLMVVLVVIMVPAFMSF